MLGENIIFAKHSYGKGLVSKIMQTTQNSSV